jgi:hypothetical protein
MKKSTLALLITPLVLFGLSGCYPTPLVDQQKDLNAAKGEGDNLSIGKVQKEIIRQSIHRRIGVHIDWSRFFMVPIRSQCYG